MLRKKQWLDDYRFTKLQYDYYVDELKMLQERKLNLTRVLTGMPSSNIGKKIDAKWVDIMEYTDEIRDYLVGITEDLLGQIEEVEKAVSELPKREQAVITGRYILGLQFKDILKKLDCSERTMYLLHESGLELIEIPERA